MGSSSFAPPPQLHTKKPLFSHEPQSREERGGAEGTGFRSDPIHRSAGAWGLPADSSGGSAPHYEVFVALRGLRNLSEENRDKVKETDAGSDCMSPSLCTAPSQVRWAPWRDGRWGQGGGRP